MPGTLSGTGKPPIRGLQVQGGRRHANNDGNHALGSATCATPTETWEERLTTPGDLHRAGVWLCEWATWLGPNKSARVCVCGCLCKGHTSRCMAIKTAQPTDEQTPPLLAGDKLHEAHALGSRHLAMCFPCLSHALLQATAAVQWAGRGGHGVRCGQQRGFLSPTSDVLRACQHLSK